MERRFNCAGLRALALVTLHAAAFTMGMSPAVASNDLNVIGFGVQSIGMGGADIPMAESSEAVNINPAGLMQIGDRRITQECPDFRGHRIR